MATIAKDLQSSVGNKLHERNTPSPLEITRGPLCGVSPGISRGYELLLRVAPGQFQLNFDAGTRARSKPRELRRSTRGALGGLVGDGGARRSRGASAAHRDRVRVARGFS